jgi:hypothetical protein
MANPESGSKVAKELGIYLGQIYGYIKRGTVVNYKDGGYPEGKGIEVDLEEVRAAMSRGRSRGPRAPKVTGEAGPGGAVAVRRMKRSSKSIDRPVYRHSQLSPLCPVDPDHGNMISNEGAEAKKNGRIWMCTHNAHDGRPRATGLPAPATQFTFTVEEVQYPQPVGPLGRMMLDWIDSGNLDLASDLETWCEDHGIEVWIPMR